MNNIENNTENNTENNIIALLNENESGLTITDLAKKTNKNRHNIRLILAKLEGAKKIKIRQIGMAKVHTLK